jgi:hypothetical protein
MWRMLEEDSGVPPLAITHMLLRHHPGRGWLYTMPIFMDTHENTTELPPALRRKVEERVKNGNADTYGVVDRGIVMDHQTKRLHCVLDAPDIDAVIAHHKALDVPLDRHTIHTAEVILR